MFDDWRPHTPAQQTEPAVMIAAPSQAASTVVIDGESNDLSSAVKSSEFQTIMAALQTTSNRSEAAKKLGISPRSLRYKMAQIRERSAPELVAG
jgi:transcriptional regulator with PAS, ATPase and Fis domain